LVGASCGRDLLPPIALRLRGHESAVTLEHQNSVGMPQLSTDKFGWGPSTGGTDGVGMGLVFQSIAV
jgi:hypothetical protein